MKKVKNAPDSGVYDLIIPYTPLFVNNFWKNIHLSKRLVNTPYVPKTYSSIEYWAIRNAKYIELANEYRKQNKDFDAEYVVIIDKHMEFDLNFRGKLNSIRNLIVA